jgi:hypothetical protein
MQVIKPKYKIQHKMVTIEGEEESKDENYYDDKEICGLKYVLNNENITV